MVQSHGTWIASSAQFHKNVPYSCGSNIWLPSYMYRYVCGHYVETLKHCVHNSNVYNECCIYFNCPYISVNVPPPPRRWGGSSTQAWMPTYVSILRIPRRTRRKPVPVPLCPPQIPHGLTWARTRASVVRGWWLTTWAMARPSSVNITSLLSGVPCHHRMAVVGREVLQIQKVTKLT
jgi:hypothetical protein